MGGGDLNLKKSWHPSTMKNMEKVWKAEQQDNQEKKRIAELKREIAMERDREEIKAFAMEQGVIEKKDDNKLDWMYKGPNESVNREDYLLGRPIDKQFEQMAQAEKDTEQNKAVKNHVEHECIPPSLRFFSGDVQVDLARKLQEDPLYAIKKKEMETRSQLLKNPVKLKQLQQLVSQQTKEEKTNKKKKKKASSDSDDSDSDKKLDDLLTAKYKKLKDYIHEEDLIKSIKNHKKDKKTKRSRRKSSSEDDSSEDSESDSSSNSNESIKRKLEKDERREDKNKISKEMSYKKKNYHSYNKSYSSEDKKKKDTSRDESSKSGIALYEKVDTSKQKLNNYGLMKADGSKISSSKRRWPFSDDSKNDTKSARREQKWVPPMRQKLSEEEKEMRRKEMMANASWRDKERARNVKNYEEQEKKESIKEKSFDKNFIQKHLAITADQETVASRIKSNINNIQRFKHSMDKNFAKR